MELEERTLHDWLVWLYDYRCPITAKCPITLSDYRLIGAKYSSLCTNHIWGLKLLLLCLEQNSAVYAPITFEEIELLWLTQTSHIVGFVITATQQGRIYGIIKTVNTTKPQLSPSKLMTFIPQPSKIYTNVQKKIVFGLAFWQPLTMMY